MFYKIYDLFSTNICLNIFIILLLVYIIYYLRNRRFYNLMSKIPGPKAKYPVLENAEMYFKCSVDKRMNRVNYILSAMSVIYQKYGIFKFKSGHLYTIQIFRSDLVQDFLKNSTNLEKPFEYQILSDWLGKGLLINDNSSLWKQRRKLMTPAFHFKIIEDFIPVFNEKSNILVQNLSRYVDEQSFNLSPLLFSCTLDAIAETTLGVQLNSQLNQNLEYFQAVSEIDEAFFYRMERPWLFPDFTFYLTSVGKHFKNNLKVLHGLTRRVINERKQIILTEKQTKHSAKPKKKRQLALLDLLLDIHFEGNSFSLEDIREEVDTFMFAGHDTSACCLNWTFFLLGSHPEIQQRLYEELESVVSKGEDITTDHMRQLPYLEAVIKESLRIYPPVPIISRKITDDFKVGEYIIPKGSSLYLIIKALHQDPNIFPKPLQFKPDRFLKENQNKDNNPFCFTPFSAGARSCIGQKFALNELKIIISKVILNYVLESLEDRNDIIVYHGIVSKPLNGIQMRIRKRPEAS